MIVELSLKEFQDRSCWQNSESEQGEHIFFSHNETTVLKLGQAQDDSDLMAQFSRYLILRQMTLNVG